MASVGAFHPLWGVGAARGADVCGMSCCVVTLAEADPKLLLSDGNRGCPPVRLEQGLWAGLAFWLELAVAGVVLLGRLCWRRWGCPVAALVGCGVVVASPTHSFVDDVVEVVDPFTMEVVVYCCVSDRCHDVGAPKLDSAVGGGC